MVRFFSRYPYAEKIKLTIEICLISQVKLPFMFQKSCMGFRLSVCQVESAVRRFVRHYGSFACWRIGIRLLACIPLLR